MSALRSEKARLLQRLREAGFNVPDFLVISAADFRHGRFGALRAFLKKFPAAKVIVRSAHPLEDRYKAGTFDSIETGADLTGVKYARNRMVKLAQTAKRLRILRQQKFNLAPVIDPEDMDVIVMPFIEGQGVMARVAGGRWEFGYCSGGSRSLQSDPTITCVPHDTRLIRTSEAVQAFLGFPCEIEYILSLNGDLLVVQARDVSGKGDTGKGDSGKGDPGKGHAGRGIRLDGVHRIREGRNHRERTLYVMDTDALYARVIGICEEIACGGEGGAVVVERVLRAIADHGRGMEAFAQEHERFAVLGLSVELSDLFQIAHHYLDDFPQLQERVSKALYQHRQAVDYFLAEADTLIARMKLRFNLCAHSAYGIDTLGNPLWSVYWNAEREPVVAEAFGRLGLRTGDRVAIDIDNEGVPRVVRV
jgi:hypothetical protein